MPDLIRHPGLLMLKLSGIPAFAGMTNNSSEKQYFQTSYYFAACGHKG
jgi:hypothetical protein